MKKIFICFITSLLMMAGCSKKLDITPDGRISVDDVWKDEKMAGAYLNTVYAQIPLYGFRYWNVNFLAEFCDEAYSSLDYDGQSIQQWLNGTLSPVYNPFDMPGVPAGYNTNWYGRYTLGMRDAATFIDHIPDIQLTALHESFRPRWKAEAHILRALFSLEMAKMYGPMPYLDHALSTATDFTKLIRPTFSALADRIALDCDTAIATAELPWRISNDAERGRMTKAVAEIIKSEAYLYAASPLNNTENDVALWQKASDAAKQALADLTANGYALFPDYMQYFLRGQDFNDNPSDKETIYEIPNNLAMAGVYTWNNFPSNQGALAGSCPSQELVDAYDMKTTGLPVLNIYQKYPAYSDEKHTQPIFYPGSGYNDQNPYADRDPRFYATILYNGFYHEGVQHTVDSYVGGADHIASTGNLFTRTGYYLRKYLDTKLNYGQVGGCTYKKYRLSELYLNYAEAENEVNGPTPDVYNALKMIRDRVSMPNVEAGLTKEQMRTRIWKERQTELSYEEARFWDVRRWKILVPTEKYQSGMQITKNPDGTFTYKRIQVGIPRGSAKENYDLFPIPSAEATVTGWQNPGW